MSRIPGQVVVRTNEPWTDQELHEARHRLGDETVTAISPTGRTVALSLDLPEPPASLSAGAEEYVEQRLQDLKQLAEVTYEDGSFLRAWD